MNAFEYKLATFFGTVNETFIYIIVFIKSIDSTFITGCCKKVQTIINKRKKSLSEKQSIVTNFIHNNDLIFC